MPDELNGEYLYGDDLYGEYPYGGYLDGISADDDETPLTMIHPPDAVIFRKDVLDKWFTKLDGGPI